MLLLLLLLFSIVRPVIRRNSSEWSCRDRLVAGAGVALIGQRTKLPHFTNTYVNLSMHEVVQDQWISYVCMCVCVYVCVYVCCVYFS